MDGCQPVFVRSIFYRTRGGWPAQIDCAAPDGNIHATHFPGGGLLQAVAIHGPDGKAINFAGFGKGVGEIADYDLTAEPYEWPA